MTRILLETPIKAPADACFDLCLNVDVQLSLDTDMCAVGGVHQGPLTLGDMVTWRAQHFRIRWRMTSRIIEVDRPYRFVDQMQSGPFAHWRHSHTFNDHGTGTTMLDHVEYRPPLGPAGRIFDAIVLARYMTRLLTARNEQLKRIAEGRALGPRSRAMVEPQ